MDGLLNERVPHVLLIAKKTNRIEKTDLQKKNVLGSVFHIFWPLDAKNCTFWPQTRILPAISSLAPDSQVSNRKSSLSNVKIMFY